MSFQVGNSQGRCCCAILDLEKKIVECTDCWQLKHSNIVILSFIFPGPKVILEQMFPHRTSQLQFPYIDGLYVLARGGAFLYHPKLAMVSPRNVLTMRIPREYHTKVVLFKKKKPN